MSTSSWDQRRWAPWPVVVVSRPITNHSQDPFTGLKRMSRLYNEYIGIWGSATKRCIRRFRTTMQHVEAEHRPFTKRELRNPKPPLTWNHHTCSGQQCDPFGIHLQLKPRNVKYTHQGSIISSCPCRPPGGQNSM